jgi:hypothetical protein
MKPFGEWFADFGKVKQPELPEGVWADTEGVLYADCVACERGPFVIDATAEELGTKEDKCGPYRHYCGGSDRCCP